MVQVQFQELPFAVMEKVLEQLDEDSIENVSKTCKSMQEIVARFYSKHKGSSKPSLLTLPTELIHTILMRLDVEAMEMLAKTCKTLQSSVKSFESEHPSIMFEKFWDYSLNN